MLICTLLVFVVILVSVAVTIDLNCRHRLQPAIEQAEQRYAEMIESVRRSGGPAHMALGAEERSLMANGASLQEVTVDPIHSAAHTLDRLRRLRRRLFVIRVVCLALLAFAFPALVASL